jgi:hypothetical protein
MFQVPSETFRGGLGIKDLEKFGRALRLRWLWFSWDNQDCPWKDVLQFQDKNDRSLFFASGHCGRRWKEHIILTDEMAQWSVS